MSAETLEHPVTAADILRLKGRRVYVDLGDSIVGGEFAGEITNLRTGGTVWLDHGQVKLPLKSIVFMQVLD